MPQARDYSCSLPGRGVVLRGLSFTLGAGITAVVGLTGAGTTTLLRALAGLLPGGSAVRGQLHVAGLDATRATTTELARKVRLVSSPQLGGGTVREVLGAWLPGVRVAEALAESGLERWRDRPVDTLPPDARSSLCLAQLRHSKLPGVVVIDQVLTPCGPAVREQFLREARRLADEGRHVVWADHGIDDLWQVADHVLELDRGEVTTVTGVGDWRPATVREPLLMTISRALGLSPHTHREAASLLREIQQRPGLLKPSPPGDREVTLLDPLRIERAALGLRGDGELLLHRDETLGIIDLSGRGEAVARRVVEGLRGAATVPSIVPSDLGVSELARRWEKMRALEPGSVLASAGAACLRPWDILAHHGSGDAANLRIAMAANCTAPLWLPHPSAMLDSRQAFEFAEQLRGPQPALRALTSRDHDFLLAACHRVLVCDGDMLVALGSPGSVARHLPRRPLLARATGVDVVRLEQLLPALARAGAA